MPISFPRLGASGCSAPPLAADLPKAISRQPGGQKGFRKAVLAGALSGLGKKKREWRCDGRSGGGAPASPGLTLGYFLAPFQGGVEVRSRARMKDHRRDAGATRGDRLEAGPTQGLTGWEAGPTRSRTLQNYAVLVGFGGRRSRFRRLDGFGRVDQLVGVIRIGPLQGGVDQAQEEGLRRQRAAG
jgi:hypothetical protein